MELKLVYVVLLPSAFVWGIESCSAQIIILILDLHMIHLDMHS